MKGYFALILGPDSERVLMEAFPPSYSKKFYHHVTVAFNPTPEIYEGYKGLLDSEFQVLVVGYSKDEHAEAVVVETELPVLNDNPHITLTVKDVAPVYSNELLAKGYEQVDGPTFPATLKFISF